MKNLTNMTRAGAILLALICVLGMLCLPATAAEGGVSVQDRVYDPAGMLTAEQAAALADRMNTLSAESGVELYLATYVADYWRDDFYGDDYCTRVKNLKGSDAVLLVVTYERLNHTYYYNMYTYGEANYAISQKEVDYILDDGNVYYNLKGGYVAEGAEAFFARSAQAYTGRVGVAWGVIIAGAFLISAVIALLICVGVVASYKKKNPSVDYPLDQYAKLNLTKQDDRFVREYVTRTYSPRSSGGGGSSGRRHGGGGGHRGGR